MTNYKGKRVIELTPLEKLLQDQMETMEKLHELIYGQMRRDVKEQIEEMSDRGLFTLYEISKRIAKGEKTKEDENSGGIEEKLRIIRETMDKNMNEWRERKEKEDEKKQEVEEIVTNIKEGIGEINKKIESSEDNIVAEVIDLERKMKNMERTRKTSEREEGDEERKERRETSGREVEEIKEAIEELKE
ncbi:unnamed protein product [Diatraea saccharalis]|uniref:Uncharacterized protein n=1 Tax=Diatraea saccharalis TaxID=40085 RepID=A0A9N9R6G6_9NEOP|nr:unnamed protein product [Diatraea saccharalis]